MPSVEQCANLKYGFYLGELRLWPLAILKTNQPRVWLWRMMIKSKKLHRRLTGKRTNLVIGS